MPDKKDRQRPESADGRDDLELALAVGAFQGELTKAFPEGLPEDQNVLRAYIEAHREQWMAESGRHD